MNISLNLKLHTKIFSFSFGSSFPLPSGQDLDFCDHDAPAVCINFLLTAVTNCLDKSSLNEGGCFSFHVKSKLHSDGEGTMAEAYGYSLISLWTRNQDYIFQAPQHPSSSGGSSFLKSHGPEVSTSLPNCLCVGLPWLRRASLAWGDTRV